MVTWLRGPLSADVEEHEDPGSAGERGRGHAHDAVGVRLGLDESWPTDEQIVSGERLHDVFGNGGGARAIADLLGDERRLAGR